MKKSLICIFVFVYISSLMFAASYTNNVYQQKARQYTLMAQKAFDEGEYDLATEYSAEAIKNTELSKAYIEKMILRADAESQMNSAQSRLKWAEGINAPIKFSTLYEAASVAVEKGAEAFKSQFYDQSIVYAQEALAALLQVSDTPSLPKYYVVRPWEESKDCYTTISSRTYVYNDPLQWTVLYNANKALMRNPGNPDLLYPGMKMEIPSIRGEYREGVYNTKTVYPVFNMLSSEPKGQDELAMQVSSAEVISGESPVLPKYYVVRPWEESKDCFTSISGRTYVYNDSAKWNVLYEANKTHMRNPENPNLIYPGMKLEIPSIKDEKRDGVYDSRIVYPVFK